VSAGNCGDPVLTMDIRLKKIFILFFCSLIFSGCETNRNSELILYDFESESILDEFHWKCHTLFSISSRYAVHGKKSLKLEFFPSAYPGLSPALKHHDWREYQSLCFEVYNPFSDTIKLVVRIDDKKQALEYNDRYNKGFKIVSGANTVKIDLDTLVTSNVNRPLELENIYQFLVFMSHPDKKYVLYLDYFRLVPKLR